ncbi:MAG: iron complex outermembrane receptor protein [Porticoccaceae bacterium]|jgi:iron complex outermembrane receptor protein
MNNTSFRTLSALAIAIATASSGAYAAELEEIIVTAQKRAESLQDVPVSLTAISGSKIEDAGMHSFAEFSQYVPNLAITENAVNTIISMRGISVGANQSFEQSVGTYVDGVHYGKGRQIRTGLFDIQQAEVLRGPQGILFGKNTLAGAINITTATPETDEEFGGKLSVSKESFDGTTLQGHVTGSIGDTVGLRFAYKDRTDDGQWTNTFAGSPTKTMPTTDETMWRASATWEPTEATRVELKHSENDSVRVGQNSMATTFSPVANLGAAAGLMYGVMGIIHPNFTSIVNSGTNDPYRDAIAFGGCEHEASMGMSSAVCDAGGERPEGTDTTTADTSLNFEMALDNGYTLNATLGKGSYSYQDGLDADWLPLRFIGQSTISDYDHKSQEFRISSPTDGRYSWVGGVYLSKQVQEIDMLTAVDGTFGLPAMTMKAILGGGNPAYGLPTFLAFSPAQIAGINATTYVDTPYGSLSLDELAAATGGAVDYRFQVGVEGSTMWSQMSRNGAYKQDTNSRAVFYQGTFNLSDSVAITAGARYTEEEKRGHAETYNASSFRGLAIPDADPLLAGISAALFQIYDHEFDEERTTHQFIPAVNVEWTKSEDSMFYMSYSEGFKSGGFNSTDSQLPLFTVDGPQANIPGPGFEYDDENAESIEIGGKHTLMDGAMTLNWAMYDSLYKNQQVSTFVGLGFVVTNAASTSIKGLEVDLQWQATDHLRLGANIALNDGAYDDFPGAGCTAQQASDLAGGGTSSGTCTAQFAADGTQIGISQNLAGAQVGTDYNGALSAVYTRPVLGGLIWSTGVDISFTDGYWMTGDRDPIDYEEGFTKTNIRTGLVGENWSAMLYGKNIGDEVTPAGAFDIPLASGSHAQYLLPGSIWGATLSYNF